MINYRESCIDLLKSLKDDWWLCLVLGTSFNFPWKVKIEDILNYYSKNYLLIFGEKTLKSTRENIDYISFFLQKGGNAEAKKSSLSDI